MRLPHGSTSFNVATPAPNPAEFRTLCEAVARELGARVEEFLLPHATPNYTTGRIREGQRRFDLLCHNALHLLAFAEPPENPGAPPVFRDEPRWAATLTAWSSFRVYTAAELNTSLSTVDLSELNAHEHKQISHWRPATVGELTFNHWD
ncbi:hypothetical protein M8C13_44025 [Crossiella sp. SN42]|uniref:hypothetical protein n=1 Tax=Crossiella sp. SN42 TaxID=2944808 RepID=UPI00207D19E4|nr:hypothetical protein [Crossiella sp. SN42]MCO1582736.1 hypothetical protein [Crossiella sp. SN42]